MNKIQPISYGDDGDDTGFTHECWTDEKISIVPNPTASVGLGVGAQNLTLSKTERHDGSIQDLQRKKSSDMIKEAREKRSTIKLSALKLGGFKPRDFLKATGFMLVIAVNFSVMFIVIRAFGLHEVFSVCGTVIVDCDCPNVADGALYAVRMVALWGVPVAIMIVFPCFYYQGISITNTLVACILVVVSTFCGALIARRYPLAGQLTVVASTSVISVNTYFYAIGGTEALGLIMHMTIVFVWSVSVTVCEYVISGINPNYYPYILPFFTAACEISIIRGMNLVKDSDVTAAISLLSPCLGVVLGINFNAYLTASDHTELAITCALSSAIEFCFKCWPAYIVRSGGELSFGKSMYYKTITYIEYTPIFAYYTMLVTDFSPMGQMVETTVNGCSGEHIIPEFADRQIAIFIMIASEMLTDFASYQFIQRMWNLGHLVQPLHFDSWISVACVTFPTVWGAMCALEASAVIFKVAMPGGGIV